VASRSLRGQGRHQSVLRIDLGRPFDLDRLALDLALADEQKAQAD
jgi:hypothetical protein